MLQEAVKVGRGTDFLKREIRNAFGTERAGECQKWEEKFEKGQNPNEEKEKKKKGYVST